jgi:hypothetical protein
MFTSVRYCILQAYGATYQQYTSTQRIFKYVLLGLFSYERQRIFLNG